MAEPSLHRPEEKLTVIRSRPLRLAHRVDVMWVVFPIQHLQGSTSSFRSNNAAKQIPHLVHRIHQVDVNIDNDATVVASDVWSVLRRPVVAVVVRIAHLKQMNYQLSS